MPYSEQERAVIDAVTKNDLASARALIKPLLEANPDEPNLQFIQGLIRFTQKDYQGAIRFYTHALQLGKTDIDTYNNLAASLYMLGQMQSAAKAVDKALELEPQNYNTNWQAGLIAKSLNQLPEAYAFLKCALRQRPDNTELLNTLGLLCKDINLLEEAISHLKQAILITPNSPMLHDNLGTVYQDLGAHAKALDCFKQALTVSPTYAKAYYHWVYAAHFTAVNDSPAHAIQNLLNDEKLTQEDKVNCYFALGKIHDDCELYDKAMDFFHLANKETKIRFDTSRLNTVVDHNKQLFTDNFFNERKDEGHESDQPIFILGMMRSGTSLVEQMLASHSEVFGAGELTKMGELVHLVAEQGPLFEVISQLNKSHITPLAEQYLNYISDLADGERYITDKMPANFQYLGFISLLFPNAKIIWCQRDPRDIILSCYFIHFKERIPFTYNLKALAEYYMSYQALMNHWANTIPNPMHVVQYESLVADTENGLKKILNFCELEWQDACLEFANSERAVSTASHWQVRQPIYQRSVGRWKHYEKYLTEVEHILSQVS